MTRLGEALAARSFRPLVDRVSRGYHELAYATHAAGPVRCTISPHHAAESAMLLSFDGVTKFYGPVIGVNDISCRVGPGITGLLGANGAGKSTLIKLASGQLRPSQGTRADRPRTTPGAPPPSTTWATAPT